MTGLMENVRNLKGVNRGEAMYISMTDFQRTNTEIKSFQ